MSFLRLTRQDPLPWAGGDYTTLPEARKSMAAALPTPVFYWKMFTTVRRAGSIASKGKYTGDEWVQSSYEIIRGMEDCGVTFRITGMKNFTDVNGPCVFVGNHMSTLETFVLPCLIQPYKDATFVVKDSLLKYPWFGDVLRARNPIVVTRKDLRADLTAMLQGGPERLAAGRSIIVFPQSSRSMLFDPRQFNSVGVKMAKKAGVPVIPVALRTDAWGTGRMVKDFGPITPSIDAHFKFGEPIEVNGNGKAEHAAVIDFISKNLTEWGIEPVKTNGGQNEQD